MCMHIRMYVYSHYIYNIYTSTGVWNTKIGFFSFDPRVSVEVFAEEERLLLTL